jgi:xylulokinase
VAPRVFGRPVLVAEPGEYVADGAARQAALTLRASRGESADGGALGWPEVAGRWVEADATPHVRDAYTALRDSTA